MQPVLLPGTCVFYGESYAEFERALSAALQYNISDRAQVVIVGSDEGCVGHDLVPERYGALMVDAEVLAIYREATVHV